MIIKTKGLSFSEFNQVSQYLRLIELDLTRANVGYFEVLNNVMIKKSSKYEIELSRLER